MSSCWSIVAYALDGVSGWCFVGGAEFSVSRLGPFVARTCLVLDGQGGPTFRFFILSIATLFSSCSPLTLVHASLELDLLIRVEKRSAYLRWCHPLPAPSQKLAWILAWAPNEKKLGLKLVPTLALDHDANPRRWSLFSAVGTLQSPQVSRAKTAHPQSSTCRVSAIGSRLWVSIRYS